MPSTVGLVIFVIYGIVLFAALAPNVVIQLPKKYSDTHRILIHGTLFTVALIVSYVVWTILPTPMTLAPVAPTIVSSHIVTQQQQQSAPVLVAAVTPTASGIPSRPSTTNPNAISFDPSKTDKNRGDRNPTNAPVSSLTPSKENEDLNKGYNAYEKKHYVSYSPSTQQQPTKNTAPVAATIKAAPVAAAVAPVVAAAPAAAAPVAVAAPVAAAAPGVAAAPIVAAAPVVAAAAPK